VHWLFAGMYADWRRRRLRHVHGVEINERILGLWKRLRSVLERHQAGTLRPVRPRVPPAKESTPHPDPPPQGGREMQQQRCAAPTLRVRSGWQLVLPRRFGWLKSLLLPESQGYVTSFNWLLVDNAEMQAVIAAAPEQVGRVLRPFCHLLGLAVPAELRLVKRVRKDRTSPRPSPHSGEGEEESTPTPALPRLAGEGANGGDRAMRQRRRTPREVARDAIDKSERTGKPIDPRKIGAVAYGYFLHWPRDGNCPPPEIGYGGRSRPLPKDYRPPKDWE
jgi:hypothetical protein